MAYPPATVPSIYQCTLVGEWFSQRIQTTFHLRLTETAGGSTVDDVYQDIQDHFSGASPLILHFLAMCPPEYGLVEARIQAIQPTRVVARAVPIGVTGLNLATSNSPNQQATIVRRGILANRKNLGAIRIPWPNTHATNGAGGVDNPYFTLMTAFGNDLIGSFTEGVSTFENVLFNKDNSPGNQVKLEAAEPKREIRTLRRRTVGRGE